jgi:hypothetical protein
MDDEERLTPGGSFIVHVVTSLEQQMSELLQTPHRRVEVRPRSTPVRRQVLEQPRVPSHSLEEVLAGQIEQVLC